MSSNGGNGNELHTHLKDIQNRMERSANANQSKKEVEHELEQRLKALADSHSTNDDDKQSDLLRTRLDEIQRNYNDVVRDGDTLSVQSDELTGPALISPTKKPMKKSTAATPTLGGTKSNDVKFAADLSEGLLVQCRKLQAMIVERDKSINDLRSEKDSLRSESSSLQAKLTAMADFEQRMKDENWELEMQVQSLQKEATKHSDNFNRATNEAGKLQSDKNSQLETIESLKLREVQLRKEHEALKSKHDSEANIRRKEIEELRSENTELQQSITELQQEINHRPSLGAAMPDFEPTEYDDGDIPDSDGFNTPENSPPHSPIKATPSRNTALEAETVKSSLGHAQKLILNLRKQLQRERSEKSELDRLLTDAREEIDTIHGAPSLKSKRSKNLGRGALAGAAAGAGAGIAFGSLRKPTSRVYEDEPSDSPSFGHAEGWEEASESDFQSAFETAQEDPTDDNYHTGVETMDEHSDGQDTETESGVPTLRRFDQSTTLTSEDDDSDVPSHVRARRRNSRYRASYLNLKHNPVAESPSASSVNDATPVKQQSLANEFLSVEDIERHAADNGLVAIPEEKYNELIAQSEAQKVPATKDELAVAAANLDLQLVPSNELDALKSSAEKLQSEKSISEVAAGFGLVTLTKVALDKLKSPSVSDVHTYAGTHGLKAVSIADLDKADADYKSLSVKHDEALGKHSAAALEFDGLKKAHEKLTNEHSQLNTDHEQLTVAHKELSAKNIQTIADLELAKENLASVKSDHEDLTGNIAALRSEHEQLRSDHTDLQGTRDELQTQLDVLSTEHTKTSSAHEALLRKHQDLTSTHEELQKEHSRDLTPDELQSKAAKVGFLALAADDHSKLVQSAKNPSLDEVKSHAANHGLVAIPTDEHNRLTDPTESDLRSKADAMGFTLLDVSHYQDLKRLAESPSAKELEAHAEKLGLVAVPKQDYSTLVQANDSPTLEYLSEKAKDHGALVIAESDHAKLTKQATEPDVDFVVARAKSAGLTTLPAGEYDELVRKANEPDEDHIRAKAAAVGLVALGATEHKRLIRAVEKPTREEIEQRAKDNGLVTLDQGAHSDLMRLAHSPSVEEVQAKAHALGYTALETEEYEKLKQRATEPSQDELSQHASSRGLILLDKETHERLQNPTSEDVENAAKTHGLVAVPVAKFQSIKDAAEAPPTKGWVESAAASLGLATIASVELTKLRQPSPEPTFDAARSIVEKNGHSILANKDVTALKNPDASTVASYAQKHGQVVIPKEQYEELSKPYAPTKDEIAARAETFGLVAIPEAEYAKLTANLTRDEVADKAKSFGLVTVPQKEYDELAARPVEYKPTQDELATHAGVLGLALMPSAELVALKESVKAEPSREMLEKSATSQGLVVTHLSELEDLRRRSATPSKDELTRMATQSGHALVTLSALQDLNKRAEEPSREIVLNSAQRLGLVMLSNRDHNDLRRAADEPTVEEVKEKASASGLEAIPVGEYNELKRKIESPSKGELIIACDALDMVAVSRADYDQLEKTAEEPDTDHISKHAKRLGLSVLTAAEWNDLRRKATQPNREDLEAQAKRQGLILLPADEYSAMSDKADKFDKGQRNEVTTGSNALLLSSVAAKRDHFEGIIKQSQKGKDKASGEKIVESMRSLGYVPVAKDEYEQLLEARNASEPTKREVLRHIKNLGMVAIAADEYKHLVKRGHMPGSSVGSDSMFDDSSMLSNASGTPKRGSMRDISGLADSPGGTGNTSELEMQTVPADYLASLRRIAENPTKEDIESLSKKVGLVALVAPAAADDKELVAVPADEYSQLQNYAADADVVAARAKELGLVVMSPEEYNELTTHEEVPAAAPVVDKEEIEAKAKELGFIMVDENEYEELHKPLEDRAKDLGLATIAAAELVKLQRPFEEQARDVGYAPITKPEPLTEEKLKVEAERLGLAVLPVTRDEDKHRSVISLASDTSYYLSPEEIQDHAERAGLRAIPEEEYNDLRTSARTPVPVPPPMSSALSSADLSARARDLGMIVLSTTEFRKLSNPSPHSPPLPQQQPPQPLSAADVKREGTRLGLSVLTAHEINVLTQDAHAKSQSKIQDQQQQIEKHQRDAQLLQEQLQQQAATRLQYSPGAEARLRDVNRGSSVMLNNPRGAAQSAVVVDGDDDSLTSTESTKHHRYSYATATSSLIDQPGVVSRNKSSSSRSSSGRQLMDAPQIRQSPGSSLSVANLAVSNATINTAMSLSERNMIPYVTQVVIGEFLHKYTRRIGVSGISDNRHERFFWVHPYSLTLYWSKENPSMEGTHSSSRVRSAAIVSVQAVEDRNPLPPGLYHKSLLIATTERTIKVTCPTRQRHNVWYNSLQFLLRRSSEDLVLEEDEEEEHGDHNATVDSRFERERARTASSSVPRGRPRVLSLRRSLAPEMNSNTRQASRSSLHRQ